MKVQDINTKEIFDVTKKGGRFLLAGDSGRTLEVTNTLFQREFGSYGCLVDVTEREAQKGWGKCLAAFQKSGYTGEGVTTYIESKEQHDPMDDDPNRDRDPK